MPKRARIYGCSKFQLAIIAGYLSLAAGGALLLSLTSLNDDIQGVAPKDMALLGAVIGAGAAVVFDNLVRWRFDEQRADNPNKYLLGGACVGLAALGAFGFPYVHGPADAVPGQFKAAAGAFLTCLAYVVVDQVVRHRYNKAHDRAEVDRTEAIVAPHRGRAEAAEAKVARLEQERLLESRQREAAAVAENGRLREALLASQAQQAGAHQAGVQQTTSLMAGMLGAFTHVFNMGAQSGSTVGAPAPTPNEASRLLSLADNRSSRVALAAAAPRGNGATARLLLADAPPAASSQRSALFPRVAATALGRAPTATPPSSVDLIRA